MLAAKTGEEVEFKVLVTAILYKTIWKLRKYSVSKGQIISVHVRFNYKLPQIVVNGGNWL